MNLFFHNCCSAPGFREGLASAAIVLLTVPAQPEGPSQSDGR